MGPDGVSVTSFLDYFAAKEHHQSSLNRAVSQGSSFQSLTHQSRQRGENASARDENNRFSCSICLCIELLIALFFRSTDRQPALQETIWASALVSKNSS